MTTTVSAASSNPATQAAGPPPVRPHGVLDPETAGQYCATDTASLIETDSHLILNLYVDQEEADDCWDEPGG